MKKEVRKFLKGLDLTLEDWIEVKDYVDKKIFYEEKRIEEQKSTLKEPYEVIKLNNKYGLKQYSIQGALVLKPEVLKKEPFYFNTVTGKYTMWASFGTDADREFMSDSSFCLVFSESTLENASFYSFGGMCGFEFGDFPDQLDSTVPKNDRDLIIGYLNTCNWLIDEGIISVPTKEV